MTERRNSVQVIDSRVQRVLWGDRNPLAAGANFPEIEQQHAAFLVQVEKSGFNWLVFVVAASGFFTDSFNLFASNVILPAIAFVYWAADHDKALGFNLATLLASAVGQLVFGFLADVFGRRSLYGVELIIVIFSTLGLLQCSPGYIEPGYAGDSGHSTWNVTVWIIFWRTVMGFGIGAEYPLSACIAAEWSSTEYRGRMMASVFLMQPIGQLCAYGAGLTALRCFGSSKVDIDKLWRYVVGIGALPTLLALSFRLYMPESGRYTYDMQKSTDDGDVDQNQGTDQLSILSKMPGDNVDQNQVTDQLSTLSTMPGGNVGQNQVTDQLSTLSNRPGDILNPDVPDATSSQFRLKHLQKYVWDEGNWIYLLGTSLCWLLLDFAFYGMGFNNPSILAKLWSSQTLNFPADAPLWLSTSSVLNRTIQDVPVVNGVFNNTSTIADPLIHEVLKQNMLHAIYTVSIPSILGSLLIIAVINHCDRKQMLTATFGVLGLVLVVAAASFGALFHQETVHIVLIVFWMIISFLFNVGPNTLTFIIPAEIFPTRYRCSFYGIAAASGKIGAVLVQIVLITVPSISEPNSADIRWLLLGFAFCMLMGGVVSHFTIPHVQERARTPHFVDKPLEILPPAQPRLTWKGLKTANVDDEAALATSRTTD